MKATWATYKALTLRLLVIGVLAPMMLSVRPVARSVAGEGKGEGARIPATPHEPAPLSKIAAVAAYGKLPLSFEANQGQTDRRVKFLSRGSGYALFLTSTEAVLSLRTGAGRPVEKASVLPIALTQKPPLQRSAVLRMRLERANRNARVSGIDELPGKSNYFIGNDPAKWPSNIPTFGRVKYHNVYSGVDLLYYVNQRELEYDFVVRPGADPNQIQLSFDGAHELRLDADGDLIVSIVGGEVIERKPVIYQDLGGGRQRIAGGYALKDAHTVGFKLAPYDGQRTLTIDPSLAYSTYLGSSPIYGGDFGSVAVDAAGNAYVTGVTDSGDFPTTPGAFQTTLSGGYDAFVSKLNRAGSALVYSTYLGGSSDDAGYGITLDSAGNAYVTGDTDSPDFPTAPGALQTRYGGGGSDAFVSKLNSGGSALVYSTYLGGNEQDHSIGIAVDSAGNAYVTGYTFSGNFPTTPGAFQTTYVGDGVDVFVSKFSFGHGIAFSQFSGSMKVDPDEGVFYLWGGFTLGTDGSINPATEPVTFGVGSYSVTLPAGSFFKVKTGYVYQKKVNGTFLCLYIRNTATPGTYTLLANRFGGTLTANTSPVPVALTIGDDFGVTRMPAKLY